LVDRGVTAPLLLEPAARMLGGRAGGKPNLAFGGGGNPAALDRALGAVRDRLTSLLGQRG
jgi:alanyl-tRNA synthetase